MLELADLHTFYGDSHVLQGVSFAVAERRCVALLGRNGAGKTTTLRSILGYVPARRGRVAFRGTDTTRLPTYRIIRMGIGYVPEDRGIFASLTVAEHLAVAYAAGRVWARPRALSEIYDLYPRLAERRGHYGSQLSGGEQQMLAIARALVARPSLLVLDEPSEGLAPVIIDALADTLAAIKRDGTTILLVEQNYDLATSLADEVHVLSQGRIQFTGTPAELAARDEVRETYLGV